LTTWVTPGGEEVGLELYDHARDPLELRNLAHDPSARDVLAELRGLLAGGWTAALPPP